MTQNIEELETANMVECLKNMNKKNLIEFS